MIERISLLALMVLIAVGCNVVPNSKSGTPAQRLIVLNGSWTLDEIEGTPVSKLLSADAKRPTLDFADDGSVRGFGGVNRLSTSIDLESLTDDQLMFSPAAMTMMAGPEDAMKVEASFGSLLREVKGFRRGPNSLELTDGKKTLLKFVRTQAE
jgi:heat shock protein HslJ